MPSKSAKQHRTMEAAAHNPAFAKKVGIPKKVATEYVAADAQKGKGMGGGKPKDPMGGGSKKPGSGPMGGRGMVAKP